MSYDLDDTIAAIASPAGGAGRAVVRLSGPGMLSCLTACFVPRDSGWPPSGGHASCVEGAVRLAGDDRQGALEAPGRLLVWPGRRSYTRQPSAEFHTLGSPPLAAAVLGEFCRCGARAARPGEFTLRAFLAGRIDLTQAEAVLGAVDARDASELEGALVQMAGGLSRPVERLREELVSLVAELEAGLDFGDEDIEFIAREEVRRRLAEGRRLVTGALEQISSRDRRGELPRVVLAGPPNVGKSRLFNALVERYGAGRGEAAIVSATPGSTRDYVSAAVMVGGLACELVDAAGEVHEPTEEVDRMMQRTAAAQRESADVVLRCVEARGASAEVVGLAREQAGERGLVVLTKSDLAACAVTHGAVSCSSATGAGIAELAQALRARLESQGAERGGATFAAATGVRCRGSLEEADRALEAACDLPATAGDELVAAEVRAALTALGEVAGEVAADDVLGRIFSQFCIGK